MPLLLAATDCRCTSSRGALRSLGSRVLGVQNMHYQHSLDQIHTLAFREDIHLCSKPSQSEQGTAHRVLPVHIHQASQHHWDEAKPSTVNVHVHKQAGGWQHSWLSLGQPSAALHQHCWERVHHGISTSLHVWAQQSHLGARTQKTRRKTLGETSQLIILTSTIFSANCGGTNI